MAKEQETSIGEVGLFRKSVGRSYEPLSMTVVETASASPILAASVITAARIQSVGQELGPIYDLSAPDGIDANTGKTFSHEWESSSASSL